MTANIYDVTTDSARRTADAALVKCLLRAAVAFQKIADLPEGECSLASRERAEAHAAAIIAAAEIIQGLSGE